MDHPSSLHPATLALAGAALSRAMTSLDWQEGQQWRSHWCLLSAQFAVLASLGGSGGSYTQAPLPAAAASPSTMFTSLPFPAAASCAAAPRLAEISRKPMLPSMPKTSPGAPPA